MRQHTLQQEQDASAMQMKPQQEEEIDLLELFMGLLAHWKLIASAAVVGAVLAALYTFFLVTPMYKATATIYVVNRNDSVINMADIQIGSALTSDYIKVFEMWEVHEKGHQCAESGLHLYGNGEHAVCDQHQRHPYAGHHGHR